jgi:hypothetical protein
MQTSLPVANKPIAEFCSPKIDRFVGNISQDTPAASSRSGGLQSLLRVNHRAIV